MPVFVLLPACNAGLRPRCPSSFTHPILPRGSSQHRGCIRAAASNTATLPNVDIDSGYKLSKSDIDFYREQGFVKLSRVFNEDILAHYGPATSVEVRQADDAPLQEDAAYQQAFTQVT